jgi:cholesterol oxidase
MRPLLIPLYVFQKVAHLLRMVWRFMRQSLTSGKWPGAVVEYFQSLLRGDLSYRSSVLLFMGTDAGDGEFSLKNGQLALDWPQTVGRSTTLF